MQRIFDCGEIQNNSLTPDKLLNVLIRFDDTGYIASELLLFSMQNRHTGLMQRIFKYDEIQSATVTPDKNTEHFDIMITFLCYHVHESQTF